MKTILDIITPIKLFFERAKKLAETFGAGL